MRILSTVMCLWICCFVTCFSTEAWSETCPNGVCPLAPPIGDSALPETFTPLTTTVCPGGVCKSSNPLPTPPVLAVPNCGSGACPLQSGGLPQSGALPFPVFQPGCSSGVCGQGTSSAQAMSPILASPIHLLPGVGSGAGSLRPPVEVTAQNQGVLVPPNQNQNPGWQFCSEGEDGSRGCCGATLLKYWSEGYCAAGTANHCLKERKSEVRRNPLLGGSTSQAMVSVPGISSPVPAKVFHPENEEGYDAAVFIFRCPGGPPAKMTEIPLCAETDKTKPGQSVRYGKVMGQPGLYHGQVHEQTNITSMAGLAPFVAAVPVQVTENVVSGDSGSPFLAKGSDGRDCYAGSLSAVGAGVAFFNANAALNVIRKVVASPLRELGLRAPENRELAERPPASRAATTH